MQHLKSRYLGWCGSVGPDLILCEMKKIFILTMNINTIDDRIRNKEPTEEIINNLRKENYHQA